MFGVQGAAGGCLRAQRTLLNPRAFASSAQVSQSLGNSLGLLKIMPSFRRRECNGDGPRTDGGAGQPPRKPPPPRSTAEGAFNSSGDDSDSTPWFKWKGWEDRVKADPQFVYKVLVEQVIGVGAAVLGDMSSRPNWGLNELDFVFSTLVVGSIVNFALMYLLAPTGAAAGAALPKNLIARLFDERTLVRMGAPGGHIFEPGFSMKGRLINILYKSAMFGSIGFLAGLAGTCISNGLISIRQMSDANFVAQNESPNVLLNSLAWTMHMGLSSNTRYQMLNGLDMAMVGVLPPVVFRSLVVIIRTLNNMIGGISFVICARIVGSQKAPAPPPPPPEPEVVEKKKRGRK